MEKYCPLKKYEPGCTACDYICDETKCGWWDTAAEMCAILVIANIAHYMKEKVTP
jgi:hypothetical protein